MWTLKIMLAKSSGLMISSSPNGGCKRLASFGSGDERSLWGGAEEGRGVESVSGETTIGAPESVRGIIKDPEAVLRIVLSMGDMCWTKKYWEMLGKRA